MCFAPSLLTLMLLTSSHTTWSSDGNAECLTSTLVKYTNKQNQMLQEELNQQFKSLLNEFVEQGLSDPQDYCAYATKWIRSFLCFTTDESQQPDLRELLTRMSIFVGLGANPNIASDEGQVTMIQIVSGLGETKGITFLLQRGADPLLRDKFNHDAYDYAKRNLWDTEPDQYLKVITLLGKCHH